MTIVVELILNVTFGPFRACVVKQKHPNIDKEIIALYLLMDGKDAWPTEYFAVGTGIQDISARIAAISGRVVSSWKRAAVQSDVSGRPADCWDGC